MLGDMVYMLDDIYVGCIGCICWVTYYMCWTTWYVLGNTDICVGYYEDVYVG